MLFQNTSPHLPTRLALRTSCGDVHSGLRKTLWGVRSATGKSGTFEGNDGNHELPIILGGYTTFQ